MVSDLNIFAHKRCKIAAQKKHYFPHVGGTNFLVFAQTSIYALQHAKRTSASFMGAILEEYLVLDWFLVLVSTTFAKFAI